MPPEEPKSKTNRLRCTNEWADYIQERIDEPLQFVHFQEASSFDLHTAGSQPFMTNLYNPPTVDNW